MKNSLTPVEELSYEQALAELETLVAGLELDEHTLDETMSQFERGQSLARHCATLLEKADLKVQQLLGDDLVNMEIEG
ncbi:MAG: exodeoxyribonuclease VII small subunit [Chloroflexi bacterium]|nr:exodeoxyribonuclease VII small subunit [Chloroflexota bacterium]